MSKTEKIAVITGAGSGIGKATAHALLKDGWSVAVTGEQGSGILRSMCEANCFIILPTDQGNVAAGALVDVQVMDGIV